MKKALFGLMVIAAMAACDDNDDDSKKSSNTQIAQAQNTATNGQWRITYFIDSNEDETSSFTNYIFEFDENNIITATDGSNNHAGNWTVINDDSNDDDQNSDYNDIDFNIAFTTPADFEELSEDWEIISLSDNKIELKHISGGNGGTDLLTFEKI